MELTVVDHPPGPDPLTGNGPSPKDGGWAFCSGGYEATRNVRITPVTVFVAGRRRGALDQVGRQGLHHRLAAA